MIDFTSWRYPSFTWRVAAVAFAYAIPGTLAGGMVSLFSGEFLECCLVVGWLTALAGALLESDQPSATSGEAALPNYRASLRPF